MYPLKFHGEAETEYLEAIAYLEAQQPGLGERFEEDVMEGLQRLAGNPQHYSFTEGGFRHLMLKTFRYLIVFKFYVAGQYIYVSAVFHTSRNPRWKFREPE